MDGITYLLASTGVNAAALAVVIYAVREIVNTAVKGLEKQLNGERDGRIEIDNELWKAVNSHGHKGLDGDDARVTR